MLLSDILYLYVFLPVFMGLYALLSPKKRPWLISAANLLFIAAADWRGLAVFAVSFICAYFSAIVIYNARVDKEKSGRRRALIAVNALLNAAVFILFAHGALLAPKPLSSVAVFGAAVIPLHAVSYLVDVYRGDCEVQTRISSLAAYIAFFPSIGFGPVLKYKNFQKSFNAPQISHERLADGIRCYVNGLAEFVLIASPLMSVWENITNTRFENVKGLAVWVGVLVYCTAFCTSVMGMLHMGQGTALMLGFPVKPCYRRVLFRGSVRGYIYETNIPLYRWFEDYLYKPLRSGRGKAVKCLALIAAVEGAAMWYCFDFSWAAAALLLSAAVMIEFAFKERISRLPKLIRKAVSAAIMFALGAVVCGGELVGEHSFAEAVMPDPAGSQNGFPTYLFGISAPLIAAGLIIMSGILKRIVRRTGTGWYRAAMPIIELVLILMCTAFMVTES